MLKKLCFLDLFSGAGGLSEGFIQAGFEPIAHIESDKAACFTLRTRSAYHWLISNQQENIYEDYLTGKISRDKLYASVPEEIMSSVINREISEESLKDIFLAIDGLLKDKTLDLIVGGPPCQAYSLVGRACDANKMVGDKRNYLYIFYVEFLKRYKPKFFIFENVIGLLSAKDQNGQLYFDEMCRLFKEAGYTTEYRILNASDYGVLQARKRIILVGCRNAKSDFYPEPDIWNPGVSVSEIFDDLPPLQAGEGNIRMCNIKNYEGKWLYDSGIKNNRFPVTWHIARFNNERDREIYRKAVELWIKEKKRLEYDELPEYLKTHTNRTAFVDRFKVVAADLPAAHTVLAHLSKDGHYYIHPDIKQNRSITPREAARLQTFPDDYFFEGATEKPSRAAAFRQIGNAVPVLLARKIAEKLKEKWI
ncbi:cytosine methyltransferase [Neisseria arctica]|uniref:Cytosine-specific methyltransferase n=1 Tax=Neisseria arctica TaxID=1470200 RepID=A0A0J1C5I4_9NEIS|nr:DNA cytosine methyltransferase [Neisseria arctica]KLT73583.1 cytosine methyltransferase [Neisseria arctica]UOO85703.1 DNA cytosine methyltransferase [Neisseria arctica]